MKSTPDAYLVHNIFQRRRTVDREANKQQICFWVGQRTKPVIFLLTRRIPEGQFDGLPGWFVDGLRYVIFKDSWDIFLELSVDNSTPGR